MSANDHSWNDGVGWLRISISWKIISALTSWMFLRVCDEVLIKEVFHVLTSHLFCQIMLKYKQNFCVAGAFLDFLSVKILKLCPIYFDVQKIERKKSKRTLFWASFAFFRVTLCVNKTGAWQRSYSNIIIDHTQRDPEKWKWRSEKRLFWFFLLNFFNIKIYGTQL